MKVTVSFSRLFLLFLILIPIQTYAQKNSSIDKNLLKAKADTLLQQCIAFEEHVGLSAGVLIDQEVVWAKGAGFLNKTSREPADAKMVHRIASITKPMTALAIMQLVEQGRLDLDVPIQQYFPGFPEKEEGTITTRHLLHHTSGINQYKNLKDSYSMEEFANLSLAIDRFKDRDLVGKPGEVYQYTTYGYMVLGRILELVSGLDYEDYMQKYIWGPAGMKNTSVEHLHPQIANKSKLYFVDNKGTLAADQATNLSMKVAGGGVQSTVEDLLLFGKAVLENKLVKATTLEQVLVDPAIRDKRQGNPYGMGWFLYDQTAGQRLIGHSGSQAGTSTQLLIALDQKTVSVAISNTRGSNTYSLASNLMDRATSAPICSKKIQSPIPMSLSDKKRFLGSYKFGKGNVLKIKMKGDQLYSDLGSYKGLKLYPGGNQMLFYRTTDAHFNFEMDPKGTITKVEYVQNGQSFYPEKVK